MSQGQAQDLCARKYPLPMELAGRENTVEERSTQSQDK